MLREYMLDGMHIHGVVLDNSKVSVTPVGNLINLELKDFPKNKLLYGTCTGIKDIR